MLNFIYYPISGVLWFWHKAFTLIGLGADNGMTWALSVVFLVFTLRLVLYVPFVKQVRTTRQMQELQPQIKALQTKYKNDRQQMALEMQKLQREHGFNPLMGCLPALAQAPVFIGLYHVLRSFDRTGHGFGQLGMSPEQNANTANYFFSTADVQSFLNARILGAPLSAAIRSGSLDAFTHFPGAHGSVPHLANIAAVAVPLMIIASLATHFNARASVARQSEAAQANPQAALMNKLALWVFPLGVLVGGPFLPIAILIYWVSNNVWTYGQQHIVFRKIDHEEQIKKEADKQAALERRAANAPKPGAKPAQKKAESTVSASDHGSSSTSEPSPPDQPKRTKAGQKRSGNRGRANQKKRR